MKAQDLRIGNLVYRTNKQTKEKLLIELTASCILDISANGENSSFIYKPIPLTEEILLKAGFERIENNWKVLDCVCLKLSWERLAGFWVTFENESIYLPHIKYLHQLQNLKFSLTNEELTINL
jgi:hypothetical protein